MSELRKLEENGKWYCFSVEGLKAAINEFRTKHKNSRVALKGLFDEMGEYIYKSSESIKAYYRGNMVTTEII